MKWLDYQWDYLEDESRLRAVAKSRAIGFSEVSAGEGAMRMLGIKLSRRGRARIGLPPVSQNMLSASWPQSKAFLARLRPHLMFWLDAFPGIAKVEADSKTEIVIRHRCGEQIAALALSTNPRSARGWRGDVRLDEWAFVPNQKALWNAVFALASATPRNLQGFKISAISTPFGDTDHFYEIIHDTRNTGAWSVHKVSINDAIRGGFRFTQEQLDEYRLQAGDQETWEQEYELNFLSSSQRYITRELLDSVLWYPESEPLSLPEHMRTKYGGVDIGRKHDLTVLCTLETDRDKKTLWNTGSRDSKNERFEDQEAWLFADTKSYRKVAVDASGLGMSTAERWVTLRGEGAVEAVTFTQQEKEQLATGLKLAMERRLVRPNAHNARLIKAILGMRREITKAGNFKYDTERTNEGGHGDDAWALALAVRAAGGAVRDVPVPTVYTPELGEDVYGVRRGGWGT